jgi:hypothetical protein
LRARGDDVVVGNEKLKASRSVFKRSMPPGLIRGWRPVRVKKTRQIKNLEPRFDSIETERALVHHQHVEHDDRRQAQDHRPDAERPKNIPGRKTLLFRVLIVLSTHDAPPRLFFPTGLLYASSFKEPVAGSLAFERRCYRRLTSRAPAGSRQLPLSRRNARTGARPSRTAQRPKDDTRKISWILWACLEVGYLST